MHKSKAQKFVDKFIYPPLVAAAALAIITVAAIAIPVLTAIYGDEKLHPEKRA